MSLSNVIAHETHAMAVVHCMVYMQNFIRIIRHKFLIYFSPGEAGGGGNSQNTGKIGF